MFFWEANKVVNFLKQLNFPGGSQKPEARCLIPDRITTLQRDNNDV